MTNQELRETIKDTIDRHLYRVKKLEVTVDDVFELVRQAQLAILDQVRMEEMAEQDYGDQGFNAAVSIIKDRIDKFKAGIESK